MRVRVFGKSKRELFTPAVLAVTGDLKATTSLPLDSRAGPV
jgi:hypothetical protein